MYFTINDSKYWYEVNGEGEPVLLLHGFTGTTATWSSFVEDWAKKYKVIMVDLPGHGKTDAFAPWSMDVFCADLVSFLNHLQLEKVHLVGYSLGGRTALSFTVFYPERVKSLILESASPGLELASERENRIHNDEQLAQRIEQDGMESFVDYWEMIPLFRTQDKLSSEMKRKIRDERLSQSAKGLAQSLRFMGTGSQPSWWDRLKDLTVPVLLLAGELDDKFIGINKKMFYRMPSADLTIVEDSGHAIHVEQPRIFGKIVNGFFTNH
ncbi:2-succinyl-6-hydroxy-2,4-cyclohexadiene-1-carboxylate synthase [Virgibacillus doumboii]|uniref:2-succinyl-6-hydroxy-2, 4-cyclohexadiene-1-carboxylate synthase n=1 Tax=Virgibacillus doumboii TaxID=2697503 RepID=UPI0013E0A2A0|nr:2-succinyl-6-hydroxy-2,4-cyclohexadiene-1-carboxylate synthase [Virgibacillus doumboii]